MSTPPIVTAANCPREPVALDATIAYACESGTTITDTAVKMHAPFIFALAAFFALCSMGTHTGYMSKNARNARDHGLYLLAVRTPRSRVPAAQARVNREAHILYGVAS